MENTGTDCRKEPVMLDKFKERLSNSVNFLQELRNRQKNTLDRILGQELETGTDEKKSQEPVSQKDQIEVLLDNINMVSEQISAQTKRLEEIG